MALAIGAMPEEVHQRRQRIDSKRQREPVSNLRGAHAVRTCPGGPVISR